MPAAGFLVRTYIVFHDCAHGSFLRSRRANAWLGTFCGLLVFTPFQRWRHEHAVHHATAGDLDRRGVGDVPTLTVAEYHALPWRGRLGYRLFRNPLVMFGLGPIYAMIVAPRWPSPRRSAADPAQHHRARTSRSPSSIGGLCWLIGWQDFLLVQAADRSGSPARPASGSSTSSTSSRTPTGELATAGATPTRRSAAAPT